MSTIRLDLDANDFISPSQGCINPIFARPPPTTQPQQPRIGGPKISLTLETQDLPTITPQPIIPPPIKAQVSLSDCLACAGCVTSAETVLIQAQSVDKFLNQIQHANIRVVSISPPARASIATRFGIDVATAQHRIETFLKTRLGVHHVLDMGQVFLDISLLETAAEFVAKYRAQAGNVTLITSACPGIVCFIEKEKPHAIPYLSTAKSAQQIAGVLLKDALMSAYGQGVSIYHACIMQCPDKKLEASRPEFNSSPTGPDVDCVLTATEFCDLMLRLEEEPQTGNLDDIFGSLSPSYSTTPMPNTVENLFIDPVLSTGEDVSAGGSGGYLSFVFRFAAKQLFNVDIASGPLPLRRGGNPDVQTIELEIEGRSVLRFSICYGFRNIQSALRKLQQNGRDVPHFIEMMACPGGCTNGGGQIAPSLALLRRPGGNSGGGGGGGVEDVDKRLLSHRVKDALAVGVMYRSPLSNSKVAYLYESLVKGDPYVSDVARRWFHTEGAFKAVPKMEFHAEVGNW